MLRLKKINGGWGVINTPFHIEKNKYARFYTVFHNGVFYMEFKTLKEAKTVIRAKIFSSINDDVNAPWHQK